MTIQAGRTYEVELSQKSVNISELRTNLFNLFTPDLFGFRVFQKTESKLIGTINFERTYVSAAAEGAMPSLLPGRFFAAHYQTAAADRADIQLVLNQARTFSSFLGRRVAIGPVLNHPKIVLRELVVIAGFGLGLNPDPGRTEIILVFRVVMESNLDTPWIPPAEDRGRSFQYLDSIDRVAATNILIGPAKKKNGSFTCTSALVYPIQPAQRRNIVQRSAAGRYEFVIGSPEPGGGSRVFYESDRVKGEVRLKGRVKGINWPAEEFDGKYTIDNIEFELLNAKNDGNQGTDVELRRYFDYPV